MSPRLAAHRSAIYLDAALFARIDELHRRRSELGLDRGAAAAAQRVHLDFERAGARLSEAAKARRAAIVERLASAVDAIRARTCSPTKRATGWC